MAVAQAARKDRCCRRRAFSIFCGIAMAGGSVRLRFCSVSRWAALLLALAASGSRSFSEALCARGGIAANSVSCRRILLSLPLGNDWRWELVRFLLGNGLSRDLLRLPLGNGRGRKLLRFPLGSDRAEDLLRFPLGNGRGRVFLGFPLEHDRRRDLLIVPLGNGWSRGLLTFPLGNGRSRDLPGPYGMAGAGICLRPSTIPQRPLNDPSTTPSTTR